MVRSIATGCFARFPAQAVESLCAEVIFRDAVGGIDAQDGIPGSLRKPETIHLAGLVRIESYH